ncbi:MAG: GspH/FimT family pseudopilin [Hyphomicrobiales bacterium]
MRYSRTRGTTLFEMLVVLTILTVLAALAAPLVHFDTGRTDLTSKAQQIATLFRQARTLAIKTNRDAAVTVDLMRKRVILEGATLPVSLRETTALRLVTARGLVIAEQGKVLFTPQGGSTGGSLRISEGRRAITIAVSWLIGDVRTVDEKPK